MPSARKQKTRLLDRLRLVREKKPRKLKAIWSVEMDQFLQAYHGLPMPVGDVPGIEPAFHHLRVERRLKKALNRRILSEKHTSISDKKKGPKRRQNARKPVPARTF